ncbi:MAG: hypothetical protein VB095_08880, partial [Anaerovorax sp.]|nr:hypothetical protein [Anaerovorax sp.]
FINLSFLIYNGDMAHYEKIHLFLKATAEDCAAGAALYYDEEEYSKGEWCIEENEANKFISSQVKLAEETLKKAYNGSLEYEVTYDTAEVTVKLYYEMENDLFRLPFLSINKVSRVAKYEWRNWEK